MTDPRVMTAYHEAGHAVVAITVGRAIQKVSIIPNKTRLGACEIKKGRFQPSNDWLEDEVLILFGGVAAEASIPVGMIGKVRGKICETFDD
jgi:ATP-dependent Zn protease